MNVIGKTQNGFLIEATENEIKEILSSVNGVRPEKIEIGNKIPAIDYATTIAKIKTLKDDSYFRNLVSYADSFHSKVKELVNKVEKTSKIEI